MITVRKILMARWLSIYTGNIRTYCSKPFIDILIATLDLSNIINNGFIVIVQIAIPNEYEIIT